MEQVIKVVPFKEPPLEIRPVTTLYLHFDHQSVDAWHNDTKESSQSFVLRNIPHYHFGPVGLQLACRIFAIESAYRVDYRLNGLVEGARALSSIHQVVNDHHHRLH